MRPDTRRLVLVWLALMALTVAMGLASETAHGPRLSPFAIGAVAVIAGIKARLVLAHYLDLRLAPGALFGFTLSTALLLALLGAVFVGLLPA